ncbi:MAG TPA: sigma-70 family RNA polymerase sigma factor [Solirubrobacterales bacterium]|nr:sigma-70 family RNA polymerase sigma factor [Solirubrobacterales bacterium]
MSEVAAPGGRAPVAALPSLLSDERLARRAAAGDERAFAAIFRRYHQRLYRYCLALLGSPEEAEDALQNTMVKALRALPGEERKIDLKPWLYRVAHNESVDLLRRRRGAEQLDPELGAGGAEPGEQAATRERLRQLIDDLGQLPERQRGALLMRELSGLGFGEIGAALGTSAATARQTLYEARLSLRQMDEGREMDCATAMRALSDGDGRVARRREIRAHLRHCPACRGFGEEIAGRERDLAALGPLPAVAAAGILQGLLGGIGGGGGGAAAAAGAGAGLGGSVALKATATVAVVAALGTAGADRGGLIDAGLPGGAGGGAPSRVESASGTRSAAGTEAQPSAGPEGGDGAPPSVLRANEAAGQTSPAAAGNRSEKHGVQPTTAAPGADPATSADPGPGAEKTLPAASSHGQQTAAAHKAPGNGQGKGGGNGGGAHPSQTTQPPSKPAHATQPPKPEQPASPSQAGGQGKPASAGPPPQAPAADPEGGAAKGGKRAAESAGATP